MKNFNDVETTIRNNNLIGIAASVNQAKTSLALEILTTLKLKYPDVKIAVMGLEEELKPLLTNKFGFLWLESKMDLLDCQLRDFIIYCDEFALLFNPDHKNKEASKLNRVFDRITHLNNKLIIATAREGYYNKYFCSRLTAFFVKRIEYEALINGTWLKERVKAIKSTSDYRLEIERNEFYIVSADKLTTKGNFEYNKEFDTKRFNKDIFGRTKVQLQKNPPKNPHE